jgi:hypothetical protein
MSSMTKTLRPRTLILGTVTALIGAGVSACGQTDGGPVDTETTGSNATSGTTSAPSSGGTGGTGTTKPTSSSPSAVSPNTNVSPQSTNAVRPVSPTTGTVSPVEPTSAVGPVSPSNTVSPNNSVSPDNSVSPNNSVDPNPTSEDNTSTAPTGDCTITTTATVSENVSTVGVVEFTTDATVTSAKIEFKNAAGGETYTAPVDLEEPNYKTLLLGMKPDAMYTYKVIVNDSCASAEQTIATGGLPLGGGIPNPSVTKAGLSPGFYVVSMFGGAGGSTQNMIMDSDGDIVWYGPGAQGGSSRAKMDYEGKYMWALTANPICCGAGAMNRVSMDGAEVETNFQAVNGRHHDIAAVPGGIMTFLVHDQAAVCSSKVVELKPDGSTTVVVADMDEVYTKAQGKDCHPNSIHYNTDDETYTVGDREASMFVKFKRTGELIWQLGGSAPKGDSFAGAGTWPINHGHHLFEQDGKVHMLLFNNGDFGGASMSVVREFELDEAGMMATPVWDYSPGDKASVLGEVQRLPNGNTLVAYTENGIVREVSPDKATVAEFKVGGQVGYVDYRPSLYGIPPKSSLNYTFE